MEWLDKKPVEFWTQDPEDLDLWHGEHGLIINTAALNERDYYADIVRISHSNSAQDVQDFLNF